MPSHFYIVLFPRVTTDIHLREPKKNRSPRRGYDHHRREIRKTLLTEQQVLEARWLYEFGHWTLKNIMEHYDLSYGYAKGLMAYYNRGKIVPTENSFPSGHIPQPISSPDSPKD